MKVVCICGEKVPFEWKQSYLKQHLNLLSFAAILFYCSPAFWESSSQMYAHFQYPHTICLVS